MRLVSLSPAWVKGPLNWSEGIAFDCPTHGPPCRLTFHFTNPMGGWSASRFGVGHHWRLGVTFATLTLVERMHCPPHWEGYLVEGQLLTH